MRCKTLVLALTVGLGRLAAAQPGPPAPPPGPPEPGTGTETTTTTTVTTAPAPPPPAPPPAPPPVVQEEPAADGHPVGLAFAIGLGYQLPTSLETPNVTSVRLRLPSGLTFEPRVSIANESHTVETTGTGGAKTTETTTELGLATLVRLPVIRHGKFDFEVLGAVGLDTTKVNPDGDNNDTTTTKLALGWGIGIGYWISPHWQLSFDATNPLISYTSTKQETGADTSMNDSRTTVGVIFSPVVSMMIHIYN